MKTPEQIADSIFNAERSAWAHGEPDRTRTLVVAAIEADRAQRHEIYIVQNDGGNVVDVFYDGDEAQAAYPPSATRSIIAEPVWEPGEYARVRIAELRAEFDAATESTSADYVMSEDDWAFGLSADDAAEIARLIEWQEAQK